jgi:N-acetylglucosamine-6-phosphate deacetylase
MSSLLVTDARVVVPGQVLAPGWLHVVDGRIVAIGPGAPDDALTEADEVLEAGGDWLLPGFVDVHVHGAVGSEAMDGDVEGLIRMSEFYAAHGVTSFLATTWAASRGDIDHALRGIIATQRLAASEGLRGARLVGAHLEGPYLNPAWCGAQDLSAIRPADPEELAAWLGHGVVRLITLAPEIDANRAVIDMCRRAGVTVGAGHSEATYEQLLEATRLGLSHVTHTFNAMRPFHHREPGIVGGALTIDSLTAELIADGVHVHPTAVRALLRARGPEGVVLVTDAMRATGLPEGDHVLGERTVTVEDEAVRLPDGTLAGSVLTMDRALATVLDATGATPAELWPAVSRNAAHVAGIGDRTGALEVGSDADLVLLGEGCRVSATVVAGVVVHRAAPGAAGDVC